MHDCLANNGGALRHVDLTPQGAYQMDLCHRERNERRGRAATADALHELKV